MITEETLFLVSALCCLGLIVFSPIALIAWSVIERQRYRGGGSGGEISSEVVRRVIDRVRDL
ncbi:MAG: hypothetical protein OHK0052_10100 [Anaerolineales bacterium]